MFKIVMLCINIILLCINMSSEHWGWSWIRCIHVCVYIYISKCKGHWINKANFVKRVKIGSTVYICTFLEEIKCVVSFHMLESYQQDLLYWLLHPELFLYRRVCVFPLCELSFQLGTIIIIIENRIGDSSSNTSNGYLHLLQMLLKKYESTYSPIIYE